MLKKNEIIFIDIIISCGSIVQIYGITDAFFRTLFFIYKCYIFINSQNNTDICAGTLSIQNYVSHTHLTPPSKVTSIINFISLLPSHTFILLFIFSFSYCCSVTVVLSFFPVAFLCPSLPQSVPPHCPCL